MTETAQQLVARLTGFTPGPWRTGTNNPYRVYDGGSQSVLHMDPPFNLAARYEANATLIAAAPDLHRELTAALAREAALRDEREQILSDSTIPSEKRAAYEKLAARVSVGKASQDEASQAIMALCKANERLALLLNDALAARKAKP